MIATTATNTSEMLREDYVNNFRLALKFGLTLTFEQMAEVLKDKEVEHQIHLAPQFNFYVQQIFVHSWKEIAQSHTNEEQKKMLDILKEVTTYDHFKNLPLLIELTFFPASIDEYYLTEIFSGPKSMDTHCMYMAYNIWFGRKNNGGVPFDN